MKKPALTTVGAEPTRRWLADVDAEAEAAGEAAAEPLATGLAAADALTLAGEAGAALAEGGGALGEAVDPPQPANSKAALPLSERARNLRRDRFGSTIKDLLP